MVCIIVVQTVLNAFWWKISWFHDKDRASLAGEECKQSMEQMKSWTAQGWATWYTFPPRQMADCQTEGLPALRDIIQTSQSTPSLLPSPHLAPWRTRLFSWKTSTIKEHDALLIPEYSVMFHCIRCRQVCLFVCGNDDIAGKGVYQ